MTTASRPASETYEEEWYLKDVEFLGRKTKIITQNLNGPCSFIAICNVLLLRGDIELAPQRESVTYEYMAQLVGDYLLTHCPGVDVGAALSIMPLTTRGMDLNPLFTGSRDFRPSGDGGALALFEHAGITLVHGWLVDPASPEYSAVAKVGDYDAAVMLVAEADHLARGRLVNAGDGSDQAGSSSSAGPSYSDNPLSMSLNSEQRAKIGDAISIRTFLDNTSSQLTYYGLFDLASTVRPGQLVALFRNSHLSVLYKPPVAAPRDPFSDSAPAKTDAEAPLIDLSPADQSPEPHFASHNPFAAKASAEYERRHPHPPADTDTNTSTSGTAHANPGAGVGADANTLYTLVTDASFVREPTVVWEALRDVDGHTAAFVDAHFAPAAPAGGDFSGALADEMAALAVVDDHDEQIARELQAQEDRQAQEAFARRQQQQPQPGRNGRPKAPQDGQPKKVKKKTSCVVM